MISQSAFNTAISIIANTRFDWQALDSYVFRANCHPKQYKFLYESNKKENLLHAGNGFGKTEIPARKHIAYILKHFDNPEYKTLNVALTVEQASFVLARIVKLVKSSPVLSWLIPNDDCLNRMRDNIMAIHWVNGAITEAKTLKNKGEAIEGKEYGYISADEVALERHLEFVRDYILLPRLRRYDDSQLDFFATPKGLNAYYRVKCDIERKGGCVMSGSSYDNTFIPRSHWDYMCEGKSQYYIDQVINGLFINNSNFLFASRVEELIDPTLSFEPPEVGRKYIDGWDLARGRKSDISDFTVKYTLKLPLEATGASVVVDRWKGQVPWTQKGMENENKIDGKNFKTSIEQEIRRSRALYNNSSVFIDSTGVGDTLYERVKDIAKGVDFRGKKSAMLENLQLSIDLQRLKCPLINDLVEQLTTYTLDDTNLETDDVMSLCIANFGLCEYTALGKISYGGGKVKFKSPYSSHNGRKYYSVSHKIEY